MKRDVVALIACFFLCSHLWAHGSRRSWAIESVSLTPAGTIAEADGVKVQRLQAKVADKTTSEAVTFDAEVTLDRVGDTFIGNDKLVVLGSAGRADGVVIFDLVSKKEIDWFYCYSPRRLSEDWIIYVEFYFSLGPREPTDVVLIYDLAKSPEDNRLKNNPGRLLPPGIKDIPIEVGSPIYPESNAQQKSYANIVSGVEAARNVLGSQYLLLSSKRLVFRVSAGADDKTSRNWIMVVDLSHGFENPRTKAVDIPTGEFRKNEGYSSRMVEITKMEIVSASAVRLYVPESKYGVSSIVVNVPEF